MLNYGEVSYITTSLHKARLQGTTQNQTKFKVIDTYKKNERRTTNFEPSMPLYFVSKAYLDANVSKVEGQLSFI